MSCPQRQNFPILYRHIELHNIVDPLVYSKGHLISHLKWMIMYYPWFLDGLGNLVIMNLVPIISDQYYS